MFFVSNNLTGLLAIDRSTLQRNTSLGFETAGYPGIFHLGQGPPQITNTTINQPRACRLVELFGSEGYSRASDATIPGSSTHGCLCSHQASTVGVTSERSSSVPDFTAINPAGSMSAE